MSKHPSSSMWLGKNHKVFTAYPQWLQIWLQCSLDPPSWYCNHHQGPYLRSSPHHHHHGSRSHPVTYLMIPFHQFYPTTSTLHHPLSLLLENGGMSKDTEAHPERPPKGQSWNKLSNRINNIALKYNLKYKINHESIQNIHESIEI